MSADPLAPLADAGSDTFLVIGRERFIGFRGFPEEGCAPGSFVGLLLHMAHAEGMTQVLLHPPLSVVHDGWDTSGPDNALDHDYRAWCETMMRQKQAITPNGEDWGLAIAQQNKPRSPQELIEVFRDRLNRVFFNEQSAADLAALSEIVRRDGPDKVVQFGVGFGLSLRVLLGGKAPVIAVDPDLESFRRGLGIEPANTRDVRLVESDPGRLNPGDLWTAGERLLIVVNAHLLNESARYDIWTRLLPALPPGSRVIVSGIWRAPYTLDEKAAYPFFSNFVIRSIDPTYCFDAGYASYWRGGSIMGPGEIGPLADWLNRHRVDIDVPAHSALAVFDAPAPTQRGTEIASITGRYTYNPASGWRWQDGDFIDLLIRRIINHCKAGEEAYRTDEFMAAADEFSQALLLYAHITQGADDIAENMDRADRKGDRAAAQKFYEDWVRTVSAIGILAGVKRILVCCELRQGNLDGALAANEFVRADFVEPSILDAIRARYVRSGAGRKHQARSLEVLEG
jgi:hypothetical protein